MADADTPAGPHSSKLVVESSPLSSSPLSSSPLSSSPLSSSMQYSPSSSLQPVPGSAEIAGAGVPLLSAFSLKFFAGIADREALQNTGLATTAFNPLARPGELVVILARGEGNGLGARLANKLAVEHFTEAVLELGATTEPGDEAREFGSVVHKPRAVALLEAGFERANGQIYAFGHKLAAGGGLSTSIIAIAVSNGELAAAKVGNGDVMLERSGEKVWLFSGQEVDVPSSIHDRGLSAKSTFNSTVLVGSHRQVPVDFLHLSIEPRDTIELHTWRAGVDERSRSFESPSIADNQRDTMWSVHVGPSAVFLDQRLSL